MVAPVMETICAGHHGLPDQGEIMRRLGLTLIALTAMASGGLAGSGILTPALSCRAVADKVARSGAVLLSAGGGRFDRYVIDQSRCALGEVITPAWAPSADNSECFFGYTCEQYHE